MRPQFSIPYWANRAWLISQRKTYKSFERQLDQASAVQQSKLEDYLKRASQTVYGKQHGFKDIRTYEDYSSQVPIIEDYDQIRPFINRLAMEIPEAMNGKAYWSLSPATTQSEVLESGIPVGTQDDSDYFNPLTAWLLGKVFAVPSKISRIKDPHAFYVLTWQHLIRNRMLTFISVWSPYFLIRLVNFLEEHYEEILIPFSSKTKKEYQSIIRNGVTIEHLFPKLAVVSCWTQGQAAHWLNRLKEILGNVPIQGKGLLSTEGVVTIPFAGSHLLSYQAHFYEFKDSTGKTFQSHELKEGNTYDVLLTNGGGLYRYNTHDTVRCLGFVGEVPKLEFLGRSNQTSDLVGEKLHLIQISQSFSRIKQNFPEIKALYLTTNNNHPPSYQLIIESNNLEEEHAVCQQVEADFLQNPYYNQAIRLGQLAGLTSNVYNEGISYDLIQRYKKAKGIKDGDLKMPLLLDHQFIPERVQHD